jgi:polysaccharide pyruvyl transferase WcaK-like protein
MLKSITKSKAIIVGGGGLWGMDTNRNVVLMSIMLFIARWFLFKKVYLLGIGFYDSAPRMGRIAAWWAGKAANVIIARDIETYANFKSINKHTSRDRDIAWLASKINPADYSQDLIALDSRLHIQGKTIFITLRRFRGSQGLALQSAVEACLSNNKDKPVIVALMEPRANDPEGYAQLEAWQKQYANVQILDLDCNPMSLILLLNKHKDQLMFVGPQFHAILSAHLAGVPYMPIAYDNKVRNLLRQIAPTQKPINIESLRALDIQRFINGEYLPAEITAEAEPAQNTEPSVLDPTNQIA